MMLSVRRFVVVRRCIASSIRGSTLSNGQNTLGVDVLKGVPQMDCFFDSGVALSAELFVFILQVCYEQVYFTIVHTQSSSAGGT
jgi:hypothetical protein